MTKSTRLKSNDDKTRLIFMQRNMKKLSERTINANIIIIIMIASREKVKQSRHPH